MVSPAEGMATNHFVHEGIRCGVEILGQLTHEWLREKQVSTLAHKRAGRLQLGRRRNRMDKREGHEGWGSHIVADCSVLPMETYVSGQS